MKAKRVIVLDVVGLRLEHFDHEKSCPNLCSLKNNGTLHSMRPIFPAVTLPAQASLTTGVYPDTHGVVANGFYFPENFQVSFWEQSAGLVQTKRIWASLKQRRPELKTASLFMQNSLYADCDIVITPKPMHTDEGLVQWCYSKPVGLYEKLAEKIGTFNLMHYWGPMASIGSSQWIANAAVEVLDQHHPDLMFVYLPHLDYCSQKVGPHDPTVLEELSAVDREVGKIINAVDAAGHSEETVFLVLSEYAVHSVTTAVPINLVLREKDFLKVRNIGGREYLDFELSPAFAMVDHQIAHIYIKPGFEKKVRTVLEKTAGIDFLLDLQGQKKHRVHNPRSGNLIAVSARDKWFSYYWWTDETVEPDFAGRIDIHRKPGYDPLELFFDPIRKRIPQDVTLVKGSHGYPAIGIKDTIPLLISGCDSTNLTDKFDITKIAPLIHDILT